MMQQTWNIRNIVSYETVFTRQTSLDIFSSSLVKEQNSSSSKIYIVKS